MKKDERVFCCSCKHFYEYGTLDWSGLWKPKCSAEGNRKYEADFQANWWSSIRKPREINKFNDCRWYEEK